MPPKKVRLKKTQEQRIADRFKTKKRLTGRRLGFYPDRIPNREIECLTPMRGFEEYKLFTSIDFEKLFKGKRVLDVACGRGVFVREAREKGILAEGLDPQYNGKNTHIHRGYLDEFNPKHKYPCVISMFGLPYYSSNAYNRRLSLYGMLRLVEPGGMLVIHPWFPEKPKGIKQDAMYAISGSTLRKLGLLQFELDYRPPTYGPEYATLIIKKKNERQVELLGKLFGVI